jgi:preprotein translocase subunit SecA
LTQRSNGTSIGTIVHGHAVLTPSSAGGGSTSCDIITPCTNNEFASEFTCATTHEARSFDRALRARTCIVASTRPLIDEARTPLISARLSSRRTCTRSTRSSPAEKDVDYTVDEKHHSAVPSPDTGVERVKAPSIGNVYDPQNIEANHHVRRRCGPISLYKRDVNCHGHRRRQKS